MKPASKHVSFCRIVCLLSLRSIQIPSYQLCTFHSSLRRSNVRNSCCTRASLVVDKSFNVFIPSSSGIYFRKTCHSRRLSPTSFIGDPSSGIHALIPNGFPGVQPASAGKNDASRCPASSTVANPVSSFRPHVVILIPYCHSNPILSF